MADTAPKLCLICGTNANKIAKYDRYNHAPTTTKKKPAGKNKATEESCSDSDDASNSKSKKKVPVKVTARTPTAPVSSRQTRNKNPKTFAASLCKAMELPDTPDHPFLQIFSQADYCGSCMTKIKDIHANQTELEKIQARLAEARVDIELDLSKHLQTIPFCKNVKRDLAYERYEEDITLILDFHGVDKKKKAVKEEPSDEPEPKRKRRQAALESEEKLKKLDENNAENNEVKTKVSKLEADSDFVLEDSTSSEVDGLGAEKTNGSAMEEDEAGEEAQEEAKEEVSEPSAEAEVKPAEEVKPVIVKIKKDPNLKCPHCPIPRYFNIPESLEEHVTRVHVDRRKFSCDLCDRKCHSQKELQGHKLKAHDIVGEPVGWVCGFCDKDFQQKRYLEDHLDRHEEAKPLNCQFCGSGFKRKDSLQRAFQIYKGEAVDPCGRCGRQLNLKDYLEHNRRLKDK